MKFILWVSLIHSSSFLTETQPKEQLQKSLRLIYTYHVRLRHSVPNKHKLLFHSGKQTLFRMANPPSIHIHACHTHLCLCLNAQVRMINFPHCWASYLIYHSDRFHIRRLSIIINQKISPLAQERDKKDVGPLLFSKTMSPGKGGPQRQHLSACHLRKRDPGPRPVHEDSDGSAWCRRGVGDGTEGTLEPPELTDHVQRWPVLCIPNLLPTWGKKLQDWLRLYFLQLSEINSWSKKLS